ncbi:MAG TPA: glutathione S-transferase family protein [Kofleriaceae bacterium]|jgi:glutathione S-transferase
MAITLYHHPFSRAAGVIWGLEEVGEPYELVFVDIMKGAQKTGDVVARNPMGKIPVLVDGDAVVTESGAIGLYLADRYAVGRLAPKLDDPRRGAYLRWTVFAQAVVEPGAMAKLNGWQFKPSQAGWGEFDAMVATIDAAIGTGPFVLGEMFSMADVVFGGTLRYMTKFGMLKASPQVAAYVARLDGRPAAQRADARNAEITKSHGLG